MESALSFVLPTSLLSGINTVDEEHRRLVACINVIAENERAQDKVSISVNLARFIADLTEHFRWEDEYLASLKYPKFAEHIARHAQIISFLTGLLKEARITDVKELRIADHCFDKLVHTVIFDDLAYVNWLAVRRVDAKPV